MRDTTNGTLRANQARFRLDRSYIDHICILRIIQMQVIETEENIRFITVYKVTFI